MAKKVTGYKRIDNYYADKKCGGARFWVGVRGSYENEEVVPRAFAPSYVDKDVYMVARRKDDVTYAFPVWDRGTYGFSLYEIPEDERKHIDWNGWDNEENVDTSDTISPFASIFDVGGTHDIPGEHAGSRERKAKPRKRTPRQVAANENKVERPMATRPTPRVVAKKSVTHKGWPYKYPDNWDSLPLNVRIRRQNKLMKEMAAKGVAA